MKPGQRRALHLRNGDRVGIITCENPTRFAYQVRRVRGYASSYNDAIALARRVAAIVGVDQSIETTHKEAGAA